MPSTDDAEFSAFVVEHEGSLLRTAFLLTGDRGHAEDLLQTALAKAYRHWSRVRTAERPAVPGPGRLPVAGRRCVTQFTGRIGRFPGQRGRYHLLS